MLNETQERIKDALESYDLILLVRKECGNNENQAVQFLNSQAFCKAGKKVLVLSADKYYDLTEFYYTYEFSDRIRVLGGNGQHGSLMNYVALGLLTEQEMFESVLR